MLLTCHLLRVHDLISVSCNSRLICVLQVRTLKIRDHKSCSWACNLWVNERNHIPEDSSIWHQVQNLFLCTPLFKGKNYNMACLSFIALTIVSATCDYKEVMLSKIFLTSQGQNSDVGNVFRSPPSYTSDSAIFCSFYRYTIFQADASCISSIYSHCSANSSSILQPQVLSMYLTYGQFCRNHNVEFRPEECSSTPLYFCA